MKSESPLGPRIRAMRLSRQLSLAEVAAGTGVSEATMSRSGRDGYVCACPSLATAPKSSAPAVVPKAMFLTIPSLVLSIIARRLGELCP